MNFSIDPACSNSRALPQISFTCFLREDGSLALDLPATYDDERLLEFYRTMVRARALDQKAVVLQRIGKLGTYASSMGAEAFSAGAGHALKDEDVFVPYYRDIAAQLLRGVSMQEILLFWGGDERGNDFAGETCRRDFPLCIPIATQVTHAAGVAAAKRVSGEAGAVLVTCGDGATSRGDFAEALNLAGVWRLPLVVLVNNNRWAISVPLDKQTKAKDLARKAIAAGIPGEQVDGNDVIAVHERVAAALERGRAGQGPTLIEALSYRLADHTTADDATRYREPLELREAWEREPVKRLRAYLQGRGLWDETEERRLQDACAVEVNRAAEEYLAVPPPAPGAMFDYLHEELPVALEEQRGLAERRAARRVNDRANDQAIHGADDREER